MEMMDGTLSFPQGEALPDGARDVFLGSADRVRHPHAPGQVGRDGGGIGASGPVGVNRVVPKVGEPANLEAVEEKIQGSSLQVAALDHHGSRSEIQDPFGRLLHVLRAPYRHGCQAFGLLEVGSHHRGQRQKLMDEAFHGFGSQEAVSALGHHHRVHHQAFHLQGFQIFGHPRNDGRVGQHPGFHGVDPDIRNHRVDLPGDELGIHLEDSFHSPGILGGEGGDGAHTVHAQGRKGFEIRLDPGSAPGVGPRYGQCFGYLHR